MRKHCVLLVALCTLAALPAVAQNTDIEALAGLQFNFGNPGARSLGMGGAFIGLADDASAAEANPAGLTILRKTEVSIEARNYLEQQLLTTSGTYPDLKRTAFTHYSSRVEPTFASFVYPLPKNFVVGVYYHEPLRNQGSGEVVPQLNQFTGRIETETPSFYLPNPKYGTSPVTLAQCQQIIIKNNDPTGCVQYTTNPFLTALDVQLRTFGLTGAWRVGNFSFGATGRYQRFREGAFTYRISATTYTPQSIAVQTTAKTSGDTVKLQDQTDVTFSAGMKWAPNDRFSAGAVYKKGPRFLTPTYIANVNTGFDYVKLADTTFHIPDVYGVGISVRPIPVLTVNADAVRVKYTNLVDNFVSTIADVRGIDSPFKTADVTELHLGAEYFFATKIPIALRAGYWRDPAHSIYWNGPINSAEAVGAAMLYPRGTSQKHRSIGGGLAWPRFQIDAAYDTSEHYKVGSLSAVMRF
jgi:long-subunit fatty acid transport protein